MDCRYWYINVGRSKRKTRRKATKYIHLRARMNHFFCIWLYGSVLSAGLLARPATDVCLHIFRIGVYLCIARIDVAHGAIRLITMMELLMVAFRISFSPYTQTHTDVRHRPITPAIGFRLKLPISIAKCVQPMCVRRTVSKLNNAFVLMCGRKKKRCRKCLPPVYRDGESRAKEDEER